MNEENKKKIVEFLRKELGNYINKKDELIFLGNDEEFREKLKVNFELVENTETVIVSKLSIVELVALSMGTFVVGESEKILRGILENKTIYLLEEGLEWRNYNLIPPSMRKKYLCYEENLKEYGVNIVTKNELLHSLENKEMSLEIFERIVTLDKIKEVVIKKISKLYILKETIITELANDEIKKNNIKIIRR